MRQGEKGRAPKLDVATTTSTVEATCAPTSTPCLLHCMWRQTICCRNDPVLAAAPRSATPSWSPLPWPRSSWTVPPSAASCALLTDAWDTRSPTSPSSRATTSGSVPWRARSAVSSTTWRGSRPPSRHACGSWTRRRWSALARARRCAAATLRAMPLTVTAPPTRATSGAFASTCWSPRRGCPGRLLPGAGQRAPARGRRGPAGACPGGRAARRW